MLTIYGVPLSVHTRKALITAMHKSIEYKLEVVIPVVPDQPPANWSTLSPTGLIPVIEDGGNTLADSTAICLYLEKKYPSAPILPADALNGVAPLAPGELLVGRRSVLAGTATEPVELGLVQPQGKRPTPAADWGRGLHQSGPDAPKLG